MQSENNNLILKGQIDGELEFSHEVYGEGFYKFILRVQRLSETYDYIPVTISERLLKDMDMTVGKDVAVMGQFRSYNNFSGEGNRLTLTVFAVDIYPLYEMSDYSNPNEIVLDGYICKPPVYRKTPFGREISDLLIAVNRSYNKSDYIPCIAWGRNARYCENLKVGQELKIWGRIQSREYQKRLNEEEVVTKTAYEISISKLELLEPSETENSI